MLGVGGFNISGRGLSTTQAVKASNSLDLPGWAPGTFNIFPNGFNRGPYILIF